MFPLYKDGFGRGGTRAAPAVTAGGRQDAANLKRAREVARARARGCGWTGGAAAVFRGGGAARLAKRVRARAGTWGPLVPGVRAPSAHPHPGRGPAVAAAGVAGEEKDRSFPSPPASARVAALLVVSGKC